jgi:hypothetical protein
VTKHVIAVPAQSAPNAFAAGSPRLGAAVVIVVDSHAKISAADLAPVQ